MRKEHCLALLVDCKELIIEIEKIHKKEFELRKKEIIVPRLKSFLEHSRSILEYCAQDTFENLVPEENRIAKSKSRNSNVYFPYGKKDNNFRKSIVNNLPGLKASHPIYKLIESIQDYNQSKHKFLSYLCDLTNVNKHDKLSYQTRNSITSYSAPGIKVEAVNLEVSNNIFNGEQMGNIKINENEFEVNITPDFLSRTTILESGSFIFRDSRKDVLEFLNLTHTSIEKFTHQFYEIFEKETEV